MITRKSLLAFARPHTIIGTILSSIGIFIIAIEGLTKVNFSNLVLLVIGMFFAIIANLFIVGLNQLTDIDIDTINKPYLPLVSKNSTGKPDLTENEGRLIVFLAAMVGIMSLAINVFLAFSIITGMVIGFLYSVPPIRLKRFPIIASFSIITVRAIIFNLGGYFYLRSELTSDFSIESIHPLLLGLIFIIFAISLVIALFKDLPDIKGDKLHEITTIAQLLGEKNVFNLSWIILSLNFLVIIFLAIYYVNMRALIFIILSQGFLFLWLHYRFQQVNVLDTYQLQQCYRFIWYLFYLEYLLIPLAL